MIVNRRARAGAGAGAFETSVVLLLQWGAFSINLFIFVRNSLLTGVSELLVINELLASLIFSIISWNKGLSVGVKSQHLFMKEMKDSVYFSFSISKLVKYWLKSLAIISSFSLASLGASPKISSPVRTS